MNTLDVPDVSEEALAASICRESFLDFAKEFISVVIPGKVLWSWHMDVICEECQYVAERVFAGLPVEHNLLINIPPGTTKSTLISILFPAWIWTRMPHARIIGTSYSGGLALELSGKNRDVVQCEKYRAYFPEVIIRDDQNNKGDFVTTKGGKRTAFGSKGMVTGKHGDFIIIDDPIDPTRALSMAELLTINYWIKHTLSSRKTNLDNSVTIMVMQRVHVDDPSAEMAQAADTKWICLPATTEYEVRPAKFLDFYKDGLLEPNRITRARLDKMLAPGGQGEAYVACQYGQNPYPLSGSIFKTARLRFGMLPQPDEFLRVVRAWDKAGTEQRGVNAMLSRGPAYTVGTLIGEDKHGRIWLIDVIRQRLDSFTRETLIAGTARKDRFKYGRGCLVAIEQEPGSSGLETAQATARRLKGFQVILSAASGTKEVRASEFSVCVNGGNCWIPDSFRDGNRWVGWAKEWVEEAVSWPNSSYLDQIDSASLGYNVLTKPKVRVGGLKKSKKFSEQLRMAR
jgi:predicted phage terminase large subunit-like protein